MIEMVMLTMAIATNTMMLLRKQSQYTGDPAVYLRYESQHMLKTKLTCDMCFKKVQK
jgi:hypothetical protein